MVERTFARFLTTWEAEVKLESSEPCPPPGGGLWDRVGDADIRLASFNRIDIFSFAGSQVVVANLRLKIHKILICSLQLSLRVLSYVPPFICGLILITHIIMISEWTTTHTVNSIHTTAYPPLNPLAFLNN
jgi:hypothetical protein